MRTQQIGLGLLAAIPLLSACGPSEDPRPYQPLGDHVVHLSAYAFNYLYTRDGVDYGAQIKGCIEAPASGGECGYRRNLAGKYRWDYFLFEANGEAVEPKCILWHYVNPEIQEAPCIAPFKSLLPGQEITLSVNEFAGSKAIIPSTPTITAPQDGGVVNASADGGVKVFWEAAGEAGQTVGWEVWPGEGATGFCAGETDGLRPFFGSVEDTGSTLIPLEQIPPNLPAEGCPIELGIRRARPGQLDPGIENGDVFGVNLYRIGLTLKP